MLYQNKNQVRGAEIFSSRSKLEWKSFSPKLYKSMQISVILDLYQRTSLVKWYTRASTYSISELFTLPEPRAGLRKSQACERQKGGEACKREGVRMRRGRNMGKGCRRGLLRVNLKDCMNDQRACDERIRSTGRQEELTQNCIQSEDELTQDWIKICADELTQGWMEICNS